MRVDGRRISVSESGRPFLRLVASVFDAYLPPSVRNHLPSHAQDIYREAFNHAFAAHAGEADQEERAHRIVWAAVKRSYEKIGSEWVAKGR